MEEKIKKLEDALCEVRKAHKLINDYQNRIGDLAKYMRVKLGFDAAPREIWGEIHYFDLGWGVDEECPNKDRKAWHVAIIPIIDTKEFYDTDPSESLLLFYFSLKSFDQEADVWIPAKMTKSFLDPKNMKSPLKKVEKEQTQYIFSFPLSSFADKIHTDNMIIRNICEDEGLKKLGIKFNINKK